MIRQEESPRRKGYDLGREPPRRHVAIPFETKHSGNGKALLFACQAQKSAYVYESDTLTHSHVSKIRIDQYDRKDEKNIEALLNTGKFWDHHV